MTSSGHIDVLTPAANPFPGLTVFASPVSSSPADFIRCLKVRRIAERVAREGELQAEITALNDKLAGLGAELSSGEHDVLISRLGVLRFELTSLQKREQATN